VNTEQVRYKATLNVFWNKVMHSNLSNDPNEVLEQGLPPLVSDYSCSRTV